MAFKRLTAAQRQALEYLKALGEVIVNPQDAKPFKALKRRGWLVYRNRDGIRHAVYRNPSAEVAEKRRMRKTHRWFGWNKEDSDGL